MKMALGISVGLLAVAALGSIALGNPDIFVSAIFGGAAGYLCTRLADRLILVPLLLALEVWLVVLYDSTRARPLVPARLSEAARDLPGAVPVIAVIAGDAAAIVCDAAAATCREAAAECASYLLG